MGREAEELADVVVVTSDNPRSEDPGAIIAEILGGLSPAGASRRCNPIGVSPSMTRYPKPRAETWS